MGPVAALLDADRLQLRGPFERQIDPVEQRLGVEFSRLPSPADGSTMPGAVYARRQRRST
jgi:hypothetical protein